FIYLSAHIVSVCCLFQGSAHPRDLPSSPTRRSSDLGWRWHRSEAPAAIHPAIGQCLAELPASVTALRLDGQGVSAYWEETGKVRSEEHTSELQSRENLVCRLLLEKKKNEIVEADRYT